MKKEKQTDLHGKSVVDSSENTWQSNVQWAAVGVFHSLPDGKLIMVNQVFAESMGYSDCGELVGKQIQSILFHPGQQSFSFPQKVDDESSGSFMNTELSWQKKDGSPVSVSLTLRAVKDNTEVIKYYEGFVTDITEHKQMCEELRNARLLADSALSLMESVLSAVPTPVFYKDREGRYLGVNNAFAELMGNTPDYYKGKTVMELWPDEFAHVYHEKDLELLRNPEKQNYEFKVLDKDGIVHSTIYGKNVFRDENGQVAGIVGAFVDITGLKQAEEALRMAEEEKTLLLNSTLDLVVYHDLDMRIIWANNVAATSVNMTQESLKGRYCWEVWHKRTAPCIGCPVLLARDTGVAHATEVNSPDGRSWYIRGYPVRNAANKVVALAEFCLDMTERKQFELQQNAVYQISQAASKATNLDELYKSVHEIIGTVMSAKNFYISLYDEKKDKISYPYFIDEFDLAPHENVAFGKGLTEYVLRTGKPLLCDEATDFELRQKGDVSIVGPPSAIWMGVPLIIESKTIGVMVVQHYTNPKAYSNKELQMLEFVSSQVAKAIEYKHTEVKLRTLSLAIEQSPASIIITDTAANIEYVNPTFVQLTGYTLEEVIGKKPRILKSGEKKPEEYRALWKTITSGKKWSGEFYNRKKNGTYFWELASISPIFDASGNITHFLSVNEDITIRKKYEKELIQAREKAEESDKLKSAFLRNLSHEIRTPMNAIMGFSSLLNTRQMDSEEQQLNVKIIQESSQQLLSIINDIVDMSSIEVSILTKNIKPFNINATLNNLYEQFHLEALKTGIALNLKLSMSNDNAIIQTDSTKLVQILSNLLYNAFKFTKTGCIEFGYNHKGTMLEFFVSDTGIGISPEYHTRVFESFYQVESNISRQYGGTGLGLAICKAYTELLGGKIWLTSEIGKGTTFYFTIPYSTREFDHISQEPSDKPADNKISGFLTILVAEDDDLNFRLLEQILSSQDVKLIRALDGKEAVRMCMLNKTIDLVLMDIKMPGMDGYSATSVIRESDPYLPVIALTAYATDKVEALKSGCSDFISKPFQREYLINMIRKYTQGRTGH